MLISEAQRIMKDYSKWWFDSIVFTQSDNAIEVSCPLLDHNNDHMSIFLKEGDDGSIIATDLGNTIDELVFVGCNIKNSKVRQKKLTALISSFGVQESKGELFIKSNPSNLSQSINMLMQAMASVDDLFLTLRDANYSLFVEDVAEWLFKNDIRFTRNLFFKGRSGFDSKFDFAIPMSKSFKGDRLIKTISSPSKQSVTNALFGWEDIKLNRGENTTLFLFLNNSHNSEKGIQDSLKEACLNYDAKPVIFDSGVDEKVKIELAA